MKETKLLDLTKAINLNLVKMGMDTTNVPKMEVKLAVDRSGSMDDEFSCGWVQNTIDLFIAAALRFDDNGKLEVGFFNHHWQRTPDATADDVEIYINKHGVYAGGGTCFAEAIEAFKGSNGKIVSKGFFGFGGKTEKQKPTYIGLITDGDNSDKRDFERQLDSLENTYVQIIAIGNGVDKRYLDAVAQKYDTVEVMYISNPRSLTVDEFYSKMLNEEFKRFITSK